MKPVNLFKALADETRLRLLNLCIHYELNVNEIVRILAMGQSRVSFHLKVLTDSGLINFRRDGLWMFYSAVDEGESAEFIRSIKYILDGPELFAQDLKATQICVAERSSKTTHFFDVMAGSWELIKQEILGDFDLNQKILDVLPQGDTVADLGCGTGDLLPLLLSKAAQVIGVEKSAPMLEHARRHYEADKDRIDIRIGELEHLPLGDEEANIALTNMVLHHLPEPRKVFHEIFRILQNFGYLLVIDLLPHKDESMREKFGDLWLGFSPPTLESWLEESGFQVCQRDRFTLKKGLEGFIILSQKYISQGA